MSKITGRFKTINNDDIEVAIYNKTITLPNINIESTKTVYFGDNPVIIAQQNDDTFEHILKTTCKITLVTNRYLGEYLFANNWLDIIVNVWRNNECIFCGAVTPMTFQQNYSKIYEELEINCVDILSTLKDSRLTDNAKYSDLVAQSTIRPFNWFMTQMKLGDTANVIPNLPDIDYQEAEMHVWVETGWERIVQQSGEIVYYGIESNCIVLDEQTAIDTGETRRGEEKEVTWVASEDTVIVDGVPYYVEYAHIIIAGNDTNTGDWRATTDIADDVLPVPTGTVNRVDGWTRGALPQPLEYYEHYTTFTIYDNGMEIATSDGIGDQIPEYPQTTTNGSYYEFRQGSQTDIDVDETTGEEYFKNYCWVIVNGVAQNSGDWVRGMPLATGPIYGRLIYGASTAPDLEVTSNGETTTISPIISTTRDFVYADVPDNVTHLSFVGSNSLKANIETLVFDGFDTSLITDMSYMFTHFSNMKEIELSCFDTSNVTNMSGMFYGCSSLEKTTTVNENYIGTRDYTIDIDHFNVSNVVNMGSMFEGCSTFQEILFDSWETDSLEYLLRMFWGCTHFRGTYKFKQSIGWERIVDLSHFNTSNLVYSAHVLTDCPFVLRADLSNWDLPLIANEPNGVYGFFMGATNVNSIYMNDVTDDVFGKFTNYDVYIRQQCTIYRDGDTYRYNSSTDTWEKQ